ncbi:hypothetical protein MicloDRAFT_00011350 [Microvirga lotononidis]|uniref:Uncharacterized protein n=1 Tax=Microvirga lotononidis TaxID=864069 RepID=I4Z0S3_9HYPH|nr:hypothetical protein MicloDRAFT_00011350 [Microvirga lotononidis]
MEPLLLNVQSSTPVRLETCRSFLVPALAIRWPGNVRLLEHGGADMKPARGEATSLLNFRAVLYGIALAALARASLVLAVCIIMDAFGGQSLGLSLQKRSLPSASLGEPRLAAG